MPLIWVCTPPLSVGLPRDGTKGRPLGSRIGFAEMSEFVTKHYNTESSVFASFFKSLYVHEPEHPPGGGVGGEQVSKR